MAKTLKEQIQSRKNIFSKSGNALTAYGVNTYRNFFPTTNSVPVRSSVNNRGGRGLGWATGNKKFIDPLQKGKSGVLKVAKDKNGKNIGDKLYITSLQGHFKRLGNVIDSNLWSFVMAMGSHKLKEFQDTFKHKKFPGNHTGWRSLSQSTKNNRRRLGLWPGKGRGGALMATGRLKDSLTFRPGIRTARAVIYPNPKAFEKAYPEWLEPKDRNKIGSRSKGNSSYGPVEGMPPVNGRQVWGRKGRTYATYHNEHGFSTPRRQYLGIVERMTAQEESLMDDYMFYSVFNQGLNTRNSGTNKMIDRSNTRGRIQTENRNIAKRNKELGLADNSKDGFATTLGTD